MKSPRQRKRRGFTLVELTLVMSLGVVVGALLMAVVNQQLAFLRIYGAQNFLSNEAPLISVHVSRIIAKADRYRLHASLDEALAGTNPRLTASPVLVLNFQQPDGTVRGTILSFEDGEDGPALRYYVVPEGAAALVEPEWTVTRRAENISFSVESGVLRMTLEGPAGEQITYSGTMQR